MNQEDIKIRKHWMFLLLANFLNLLPIYFLMSKDLNFASMPQGALPFIIAFQSIIYFGFSYLLYRCAYKKPGTKLLTFILFSSVLGWISLAAQWVRGSIGWNNPFHWTVTLVQQIVGVYWFFLNWKMRLINKKLKTQTKTLEAAPDQV